MAKKYLVIEGSQVVGYVSLDDGDTYDPGAGRELALLSPTTSENNNLRYERMELGISSTTIITTGAKGRKTMSYTGTIVGWRLVSDVSTTTTIDLWKANGSIPTNANSITASAKPSLTAATLNSSSTLTGWTTSIAVGDVIIIEVEANDAAKYLALELQIRLD